MQINKKRTERLLRPESGSIIVFCDRRPAAIALAGTDGFFIHRDQFGDGDELISLTDEIRHNALDRVRREVIDIVIENDRAVRRALECVSLDFISVFDAPVMRTARPEDHRIAHIS